MGGSKSLKNQRDTAQQQQNQIFQQMNTPSQEVQDFRRQKGAWDSWISGKNYAKPPSDSILNFDLFMPAHEQKQRERMADLTGIGATQLGMGGDESTALQLARERNINAAAEQSGAAYETAVHAQDQYYKGNALPVAQADLNRQSTLLGNSSQRAMQYGQMYEQSKFQNTWLPMILGGAMQAGAAALGNPALMARK